MPEVRGRDLTDEEKDKIIRLYIEEEMGLHDIKSGLSTGYYNVQQVVKEAGVKRSRFEVNSIAQHKIALRRDINRDLFEDVCNEARAYFLGYMTADGYVIGTGKA